MQGEVATGKQCPILVDEPIYNGPVVNPLQPPPHIGCRVQTGGTCRDGHTYSAECEGERFDVAMPCKCMVDGVANGKTVNAPCMEAGAACGLPASR
jgi:hypothetical protein